jgi:hypothetical protein
VGLSIAWIENLPPRKELMAVVAKPDLGIQAAIERGLKAKQAAKPKRKYQR